MDITAYFTKITHFGLYGLIFIITLSILVCIHEWGHFIAARLAGVKVFEFAFGMGKLLFSKKIGDTDYQLRLFPMGGYVKLAGEEIPNTQDYKPEPHEFYGVSPLKRLGIVFAGPFMNMFLAFLCFWIVAYTVGENLTKPYIGYIEKSSPAAKAGIQSNDIIKSIDNKPIESFEEFLENISTKSQQKTKITVIRNNKNIDFELIPDLKIGYDIIGDSKNYGDIGISSYMKPIIGNIQENSPAAKAGFKTNDVILKVNNTPINFWNELVEIIQASPDKKLNITYLRDKIILNTELTPELKTLKGATSDVPPQNVGAIGVMNIPDKSLIFQKKLTLLESFNQTCIKTYFFTTLTYKILKKMFQGKVSRDNLMGPVRLAGIVSDVASTGFLPWLLFLGFISHQLAIVNFLPFPALDGGHALFFLIEMIIGKPVNLKLQDVVNRFGFTLLIGLFVFVVINDITNIVK